MRPSTISLALLITACVCAATGPACAKKPSRTPVTSGVKQLKMSPQELRLRVRALIRPTLGIVEEAADRGLEETKDPTVRREILIWKIEATSTLLSAMLRNDPVLALADAWAYAVQVENFLATPEIQARFGTFVPRASAAMVLIQTNFRAFAGSLQSDITGQGLEAKVRDWAAKHPIEGALNRRPSVDSEVAALIAPTGGKGALAAIGNLDETTAEVMTRMDLYTMYLPRLARWEAELAADDLSQGIDTKDVLADLDRFTRAADRIAGALEIVPEALKAERIAATHDLQEERRTILDTVRQERIATLVEVEAIAQRLVDRSSGPLHDTVHKDAEELLKQIEIMEKRLNDDVQVTLSNVVDHAYDRALRLLLIASAIAAVFGLVGLVFVARFLRR